MAESTQSPGRLGEIDILRGLAVLGMIAAHGSDAFLAEASRDGWLYHRLSFLFGLVAPAFLFASGLALPLAIERSNGRRRVAQRLLRLLAIGYWLQIPIMSLRQLVWNRRPEELARLFDANILQVIALCGLVVVALHSLGIAEKSRGRWLFALALLSALLAPFVWHSEIGEALPRPLGAYLSPQPLATFPLLPYAAYLFTGALLSPTLRSIVADGAARQQRSLGLILGGGGVVLLSWLLDLVAGSTPPFDDYWHGSTQLTLLYTGSLVVLGGVVLLVVEPQGRRGWLEWAGRRSLAIYLVHLVLIYGSPMTMGLRSIGEPALARSLGPPATILLTVAVAVVTCALVAVWEWLRMSRPRLARVMVLLFWLGFLGWFLGMP